MRHYASPDFWKLFYIAADVQLRESDNCIRQINRARHRRPLQPSKLLQDRRLCGEKGGTSPVMHLVLHFVSREHQRRRFSSFRPRASVPLRR